MVYFFKSEIENKYKQEYRNFCNETNVARLPYFFLFVILHRIFALLVFLAMAPGQLHFGELFFGFPFLYNIFYFILVILASVGAKRFKNFYKNKSAIVFAIYLVSIGLMLVDEIIVMHIFANIYNPVRFLGAVALVAIIPAYSKAFASFMIIAYASLSLIINIIFQHGPAATPLGAVYFGFAAALAILISAGVKHKHEKFFMNSKEEAEKINNLKKLIQTDALTKVSNRHAFNEHMDKIWAMAARDGGEVAIIMMDLDKFKLYNDNFGHIAGDKCLIRVAEAMSACFHRSTDIFARYGGEEFVAAVLKDASDDLTVFAEKIRKKVEDLKIPNPANLDNPFITVSVGVASAMPNDINEPFIPLLKRADGALYAAKMTGRNKVVVDFCGLESINTIIEKSKKENEKANENILTFKANLLGKWWEVKGNLGKNSIMEVHDISEIKSP